MGLRFRRSIRLAKGLRINLSKSGASLSVGRRGATVNFGPKGEKLTVGMPGTGLSYSKMLRKSDPQAGPSASRPAAGAITTLIIFLAIALLAVIITAFAA